MPLFSSTDTPMSLLSGGSYAVLNAENLAANALTIPISLIGQPNPVMLCVVNGAASAVQLVASADNKADGSTYYPVVSVASGMVQFETVSPGLFYSIRAVAAITGGTVWLAR